LTFHFGILGEQDAHPGKPGSGRRVASDQQRHNFISQLPIVHEFTALRVPQTRQQPQQAA
jgi:hypothetical protein